MKEEVVNGPAELLSLPEDVTEKDRYFRIVSADSKQGSVYLGRLPCYAQIYLFNLVN